MVTVQEKTITIKINFISEEDTLITAIQAMLDGLALIMESLNPNDFIAYCAIQKAAGQYEELLGIRDQLQAQRGAEKGVMTC
jgi:hypothetical protein